MRVVLNKQHTRVGWLDWVMHAALLATVSFWGLTSLQ
jgi:hypothetical protein